MLSIKNIRALAHASFDLPEGSTVDVLQLDGNTWSIILNVSAEDGWYQSSYVCVRNYDDYTIKNSHGDLITRLTIL